MKASAASSMATSTSWPRPVGVRWKSALATASAAVIPPMVSQMAKPARVGPWAGSPVIDMMPDMAWSFPSKAAVVRSGPVRPKPETAQKMSRGIDGGERSQPSRPSLSMNALAAEVFPHDVGAGDQPHDDLHRLRPPQVEGDAALVAVHGQEKS